MSSTNSDAKALTPPTSFSSATTTSDNSHPRQSVGLWEPKPTPAQMEAELLELRAANKALRAENEALKANANTNESKGKGEGMLPDAAEGLKMTLG